MVLNVRQFKFKHQLEILYLIKYFLIVRPTCLINDVFQLMLCSLFGQLKKFNVKRIIVRIIDWESGCLCK